MSNPIAGWYPDPSGDLSKLRYWDGASWTDRFMDRPIETPTNATVAQDAGQSASQPSNQATTQNVSQQQVYSNPVQPNGQGYNVQVNIVEPAPRIYQLSEQDKTLRLIAFIFAVICTVSCGIFIIPLCWMIPMTVHCWNLYKGTKPNTVAFGVCSLIFLSLVTGVLLLVSTKEEQ